MSSRKKQQKAARANPAKAIRNEKILIDAANGKTINQIAQKFEMERSQIRRILNKTETLEYLKEHKQAVLNLVGDSVALVEHAIKQGHSVGGDLTNALKAAIQVLKTYAVIADKIDISHSFPKPTIIENLDGGETILGAQEEGDE